MPSDVARPAARQGETHDRGPDEDPTAGDEARRFRAGGEGGSRAGPPEAGLS